MDEMRLSDVVYDYYSAKIRFGFYQCGDLIPSISQIGHQFQIGGTTVRAALVRLKKDGYITTSERKATFVVYRPGAEDVQKCGADFMAHRAGLQDLCRFSGVLFDPIAFAYFQRQDKSSLKQLSRIVKDPGESESKRIIRFYAVLMARMHNPLLLNLFWEMIRYVRYPAPRWTDSVSFIDPLVSAQMLQNFLVSSKEHRADDAVATARSFHRDIMTPLFQQTPADFQAAVVQNPIAFDWQIYRDRPQLCYSLAEQLMIRIDTGFYPQGTFFPSIAALAEEFGVSPITMRRTVELLDHMCFTKTFNGVGTQVIYMTGNTGLPDFQGSGLRKNQILFLQALHLTALTIQSVALDTLSRRGPAGLLELSGLIQTELDKPLPHHFLGQCLEYIGQKSPSALIQEVYGKLQRLMVWGCALHIFSVSPEITAQYRAGACGLQAKLRDGDIPGFSQALAEFVSARLDASRGNLIRLGFRAEELV